jgi:hypothetical protein
VIPLELQKYYREVRFEVFTAMKILVFVFWVVILCNDVGGYQCFRGPCCLRLHAIMAQKTAT